MKSDNDLFPTRHFVGQILNHDDFFLWEYYGKGLLGRIQSWIFKKRLFIIHDELRKNLQNLQNILDVGCGSAFAAFVMLRNYTFNYFGIDFNQKNSEETVRC